MSVLTSGTVCKKVRNVQKHPWSSVCVFCLWNSHITGSIYLKLTPTPQPTHQPILPNLVCVWCQGNEVLGCSPYPNTPPPTHSYPHLQWLVACLSVSLSRSLSLSVWWLMLNLTAPLCSGCPPAEFVVLKGFPASHLVQLPCWLNTRKMKNSIKTWRR